MSATRRLLLYSHDTFGLGHIRRTQKIANALASPDWSILVACASPKTASFSSRPGIEYLNLPGFAKQVSGEYLPRSLNIPGAQFVNLRASLLLSAARSFNPDLLIVDKEPLGVKGELLPALEYLRADGRCRTACGFRDILDEPSAVAAEWAERGTERGLREFYDDILVYGDRAVYDFAAEYRLAPDLAERVIHTGYLNPDRNLDGEELPFRFGGGRPVVTFTLGGGGDGWELMEAYLDALMEAGGAPPFHSILLTGPFAPPSLLKKAKRAQETTRGLESADFVSNTQALFARSDAVVCMGGYNTLCELAALRKFPLVVPRVVPRREQLLRARAFKRLGYCDYLEPERVDGRGLLAAVTRHLASMPRDVPALPTPGLARLRGLFEERFACPA